MFSFFFFKLKEISVIFYFGIIMQYFIPLYKENKKKVYWKFNLVNKGNLCFENILTPILPCKKKGGVSFVRITDYGLV